MIPMRIRSGRLTCDSRGTLRRPHDVNRACTRRTAVDGVEDVVVRVRGRERQRQHLVAGALGDRQARLVGVALAEPRQAMHRQEVDARGDQLVGERVLVRIARRARAAAASIRTA